MCRSNNDPGGPRVCPSHLNKELVNARQRLRYLINNGGSFSKNQGLKRLKQTVGIVKALEKEGQTTDLTLGTKTDHGVIYPQDRREQHQQIVEAFLDLYENVPCDGKVIFAGGLGGAGKSTVLSKEIDSSKYATLNPDDVKEVMAHMGMIPKITGLTPMEASPLVHEEASSVTFLILDQLRKRRKNIIFDITMSSVGGIEKRLDILLGSKVDGVRSNGNYKTEDISVVFVDIKPETSKQRGQKRYLEGLEDYTTHESDIVNRSKIDLTQKTYNGGRVLPDNLIDEAKPSNPVYNSKNMEVLVTLYRNESIVNKPLVYDNNASPAEGSKDFPIPVKKDFTDFLNSYDPKFDKESKK